MKNFEEQKKIIEEQFNKMTSKESAVVKNDQLIYKLIEMDADIKTIKYLLIKIFKHLEIELNDDQENSFSLDDYMDLISKSSFSNFAKAIM